MASEQVRLASVALGPLIRKRGTSPALGASLRRAVQSLDIALVEEDERASSEAAARATQELQQCLPLIQGSTRPADHAQLEGITKVLSFLAPPEVAKTAVPVQALPEVASLVPEPVAQPPIPQPAQPPPSLPSPTQPLPSPPPEPPRAPEPAKAGPSPDEPRVSANFPTVHLRVEGIQESLRILRVALDSPLATLGDLESVHARMRKFASAVKWLAPSRVGLFRDVAGISANSARQVAADLALFHLGDHQRVERLLANLEKAALAKQWLPSPASTVLRVLAATQPLDILLDFFTKTSSSELRALLLPVLAERDALPAGQLLDLAIDHDDEIAARAAEALAWTGDAGEASLLFTWAVQAKEHGRANALLFAAAVLGSTAAVVESRKRLFKPAMSVGYLADALAIAGDGSDTRRLLDLAMQPIPDLSRVLLDAANLGCVETISEFDDFVGRAPVGVVEEVRRFVLGRQRRPPQHGGRLLHGQPWSVAGVLDRLSATDEPWQSANRMALELRVRTGIVPPCRLPLVAPTAIRAEAVTKWRSHYAKADAKLAAGTWHYQGRPIPEVDKKGSVR
jgi:hypothetical protein